MPMLLIMLFLLATPAVAADTALDNFITHSKIDILLAATTDAAMARNNEKLEALRNSNPLGGPIADRMEALYKKVRTQSLADCTEKAKSLITQKMSTDDLAQLNAFAQTQEGELYFNNAQRRTFYTRDDLRHNKQETSKEQQDSINRFLVTGAGLKIQGLDQDIANSCRTILHNNMATHSGAPFTPVTQ